MALVGHTTDRFAALIGATAAVRDLDPSPVSADRTAKLAEDADEWSAAGGFPSTARPRLEDCIEMVRLYARQV